MGCRQTTYGGSQKQPRTTYIRRSLGTLPTELILEILEHLIALPPHDISPLPSVHPKHLAEYLSSPPVFRQLHTNHALRIISAFHLHLTVAIALLLSTDPDPTQFDLPDRSLTPQMLLRGLSDSHLQSVLPVHHRLTQKTQYMARLTSEYTGREPIHADWYTADMWFIAICERWIMPKAWWEKGHDKKFMKEYHYDAQELDREGCPGGCTMFYICTRQYLENNKWENRDEGCLFCGRKGRYQRLISYR